MFKKTIMMTVLVLVCITACGRDPSPLMIEQTRPMRPLTAEEQFISDAAADFGLDLFKEIAGSTTDQDLFISPLSISMALGMTMNGADGETYAAMRQTLRFGGMSEAQINGVYKSLIELLTNVDPNVIFEIANSIWYRDQFTINSLFLETNRTFFDATILPKDFNDPSTVNAINDWVSDKTHQKITSIIDKIDPLTLMFLINAIYFKGTWQYEFDKDKTIEAPFYLPNNQTSTCQLMQIEKDFRYYANEKLQIIDLPYGAGNFSMTVFLPRLSENLDEFIAGLDPLSWQNYINQMDTASVSLKLPKFKLEYKISLNAVLKKLGMGVAFVAGEADFSRIIKTRELFISNVLHKTFVQVDEEGTEAAAVTVVEVGTTSIGPPPGLSMRVDHPFLFALRERQSGTILFLGKMIQPEWPEN